MIKNSGIAPMPIHFGSTADTAKAEKKKTDAFSESPNKLTKELIKYVNIFIQERYLYASRFTTLSFCLSDISLFSDSFDS